MTVGGNPGSRTTEELRANHDCSSPIRFCPICRTNHEPSPQCPMRYDTMKDSRAKLAFVASAVSSSNFSDCLVCYKNGSYCSDHLLNYDQH